MTIDLDFRQRQTIVIYDEDNGAHEVLMKKESRRLSFESKSCMVRCWNLLMERECLGIIMSSLSRNFCVNLT